MKTVSTGAEQSVVHPAGWRAGRSFWLAGVAVGAMALATPAAAQSETVQELIVTGSRSKPRTVLESPVPVDAFSAEDIQSISVTDTQDLLKTLIPSYTLTRQPISDGATFIRPASLRGLPSDKTLLLVNSKRRHRSALVVTGGSGVQAQDAAQIPASALKSVEVLRDGAGAQYGSDAIAGVINFILKDSASGGGLSIQAGQYYERDGEAIIISGDKGFALGENGFVHAAFEYATEQLPRGSRRSATATSRTRAPGSASRCSLPRPPRREAPSPPPTPSA